MMRTLHNMPSGWLLAFGNAAVRFDTRPEARRYAKDYQKQVAARGGKFKPSISRCPARMLDNTQGTAL